MSKIIESYYRKTKLDESLIQKKIGMFSRNADIQKEFEYWITNKKYMDNGVVIEGYSATKIAKLSRFVDGEGAFILLVKLRETPEAALKQISAGFKMK